MAAEPERIISICKLPDGRFAVRNERNVKDLTKEDRDEMATALIIWFRAMQGMEEARAADD